MRRVLGLVLIALAVVVITPAGSALSQLEAPSAADPTLEVIPEDPTPAASDGPELTAAQKADAVKLLAADRRAQEFLVGTSYAVESVGPWTTGGAADRLVGALVILKLAAPTSFSMSTWPVADYSSDSDTSYSESKARFAADNATGLVVNVDLAKGRVVGIQPDGDDIRITPAAGTSADAEAAGR